MADIATLILDVRAQGAAQLPTLNSQLMSVAGAGDRASASARGLLDTLGSVKSLVLGGVFGSLARDILSVNAEYETLGVTLRHVLKDQGLANDQLEELRDLAAKTPLQLGELSKAFIRLKSLGLDASTSTLRAFGDIASAIPGKSIMDFTEAVADATQGNGRRLREFGISMNKVGDEFEISFGKTKLRVENDGAAIEAALLKIAQTEFGGLMAAQAETVAGKFSTLKDNVDALIVSLGQGGLNEALKESIEVMSSATGEGDKLAGAIGKGLGGAVTSVTALLDGAMKSLSRWVDIAGQVSGLIERIPGAKALMESGGGSFAAGGGAGIALALSDAAFGSDPLESLLGRRRTQSAQDDLEASTKKKTAALQGFVDTLGGNAEISAFSGWLGKMKGGLDDAGDAADKTKGKVKDLADEIQSLMFFDTGLGLKGFTPGQFDEFTKNMREGEEGSFDVMRDTGGGLKANPLEDLRAGLPAFTAQVQQEGAARDFADSPFGKFIDDSALSLEKLETIGLSVFDKLTDSMIEFITTGKTNWEDMFRSIFASLLKLAANGVLSSLLGGGGGGLGGAGGLTLPTFHSGGVVGGGAPGYRTVSPLALAGAPRYHGGGIAGLRPDEVPAILQRGERVIPKGGGGQTIQNIRIQTTDADSFGRDWPSTLRRLGRLTRRRR